MNQNLSESQFWRVHPDDRPFSREDASSQLWNERDTPRSRGYSAMRSPEELVAYFNPQERERIQYTAHVLSFRGEVVGKGPDSEPLVVPHSDDPDERMEWSDMEDRVGADKVAEINKNNGWD